MPLVVAVSVSAMLAAPKLMVPPALRVITFMRRTDVPEVWVTLLAPALMVVEATTSVWAEPPFCRFTVPPESARGDVSSSLLATEVP